MGGIRIQNVTRDANVVTRGCVADNMWTRLKGLIGSPPSSPAGASSSCPVSPSTPVSLVPPSTCCTSTARTSLSAPHRSLPPRRFGRFHRRARYVIELPAGTLEATGTELGDRLRIQGCDP
jgi:hypothetical protein